MQSVNRAEIIGHLGDDPKVHNSARTTIVRLRIATTRRWSSEDGKKHEETDWHNVSCFGQIGTNAAKYLRKGRYVRAIGRMRSSTYEKDGLTVRAFEIVATEPIGFMDSNPKRAPEPAPEQAQGEDRPPWA